MPGIAELFARINKSVEKEKLRVETGPFRRLRANSIHNSDCTKLVNKVNRFVKLTT